MVCPEWRGIPFPVGCLWFSARPLNTSAVGAALARPQSGAGLRGFQSARFREQPSVVALSACDVAHVADPACYWRPAATRGRGQRHRFQWGRSPGRSGRLDSAHGLEATWLATLAKAGAAMKPRRPVWRVATGTSHIGASVASGGSPATPNGAAPGGHGPWPYILLASGTVSARRWCNAQGIWSESLVFFVCVCARVSACVCACACACGWVCLCVNPPPWARSVWPTGALQAEKGLGKKHPPLPSWARPA